LFAALMTISDEQSIVLWYILLTIQSKLSLPALYKGGAHGMVFVSCLCHIDLTCPIDALQTETTLMVVVGGAAMSTQN